MKSIKDIISHLQDKVNQLQRSAANQDNYTRQYIGGKVDMANEVIAMLLVYDVRHAEDQP